MASTGRGKALLTSGEAAARLGVSIATLRRWANAGHIVSVRTPGGQRRFRSSDLDALPFAPAVEPAEAAS